MLIKHCKNALVMAGTFSMVVLGGCTDDSLDVTEIDTTMKVEVNDLVLPINLAPIVFDDMVDLDENEDIKKINGEYVLIKSGEFNSEEINIKEIRTDAEIHLEPMAPIPVPHVPTSLSIDLEPVNFPFSYSYDGVDKYIREIYSGKVDVNLTYTITAKDGNQAMNATFENMKFELPQGFYGEVYGTFADRFTIDENSSNVVTISSATTDANGDFSFVFHITSFVFANIPEATFKDSNFSITTGFGLQGGKVTVHETKSDQGSINMSFEVSELEVKTFSGKIYYDLDNLDPEAISLGDLPDVLTDKNTHLGLKNPQLYIKLTNPLGKEGLTASTGLEITQQRPEGEPIVKSYLKEGKITIDDVEGEQNFCLSPINPGKNMYDKFPGAKWNEMVNLGDIINGNGLPDGLNVSFINPQIDENEVHDFELAQDLGVIHGEYTFFAPLELSSGSSIYYEEVSDDWDLAGEDNQNELELRLISLTADCVSDLPVNVTIDATPLDSKGNEIKTFEVKPVKVAAFGKEPIEIEITGDIKDLDGMRFKISVDAGQKTAALKPTMSLKLDNLKVKVSGSYIVDPSSDN